MDQMLPRGIAPDVVKFPVAAAQPEQAGSRLGCRTAANSRSHRHWHLAAKLGVMNCGGLAARPGANEGLEWAVASQVWGNTADPPKTAISAGTIH